MLKHWARRLGVAAVLITGALWLGNTSLFVSVPIDREPRLIAHRGVHQIYAGTTRDAETCSANPIHPLKHDFIANTLPSINAAFAYGADVVEVDVHLTTDGVFALFHDWTLDCQTNGAGVTHKQAYSDIRGLDLGYGYSTDGVTFPLRGKGVAMMPSLKQAIEQSEGGQFLVNFKGNRRKEGVELVTLLQDPQRRERVYGVYGGGPPTRAALDGLSGLRGFDRSGLKSCLFRYLALGWTSYVPQACRNGLVAVPLDYAPLLWGWPHRFTNRMKRAGTEVILWGPYDGSGFSSGIDDIETLDQVPEHFDGYIWTNRIEIIGPKMAR
ncbi:glycerophosphodiester phosphodiesterase family protein [Thalassococcus lentus]|uniref:Glycerophosphodiester phosphodiesterase family protein n=1 Tax=Thalassococcus lentus TaxID=1210524 RepID=A0ABT4XMK9_9RHOB|nr:glycerophosphodiester phosphodiesterase family protein [Thalassococcus lentus]MDA7423179.1 glycerophosphodiester phosphodiesterase family protein [Thalassococcus lentus]